MVLHVRCVPERFKRQGNSGLRGGSVELCLREGLFGVCPKSHNVSHRLGLRNEKTYEYIRMNNIQLV